MALSDFLSQLNELLQQSQDGFGSAQEPTQLEEIRVEYLGAKQGRLKATQKLMGKIDAKDRPAAGKRLNEVKQAIDAAFQQAKQRLEGPTTRGSQGPASDVTLPGVRPHIGHLHPITQTIEELMDIMGRLGFTAADGPEIEDEWHNFEALNIPHEHPARDPLENFYLSTVRRTQDDVLLLRSQTSTVQIRVMETYAAADPHHLARPRLSPGHSGCDPLSHVPSNGGPAN